MRTAAFVWTAWAGLVIGLAGCGGGGASAPAPTDWSTVPVEHPEGSTFEIPSGLDGVPPVKVEVVRAGRGKPIDKMTDFTYHVVKSVEGGKEYQSSRTKAEPLSERAGVGAVLTGADKALVEMRGGDLWRVTIPPALAHGVHGGPFVPSNATVVWEIEIVGVK